MRTFGGDNRYGDYSGSAIDPSTGLFWGINQAATSGGTVLSGEDGRWQIFLKELDITDELPVELLSFEVRGEDNRAILDWRTGSEINNEGFIIEQYIDKEFQRIGFKEGNENTNIEQSYSFEVGDLAGGTHLFRLRQIDFDGAFSLSEVKGIEIEGAYKNRVGLASPNPFGQETKFTVEVSQNQQVSIQIYDINGRLVESLSDHVLERNREHSFVFDAASLPDGMYAIQVSGLDFNEVLRIVLKR